VFETSPAVSKRMPGRTAEIHLESRSAGQVGSAQVDRGRAHQFMAIALSHYFITKDPGIQLNAGVLRPIGWTRPAGRWECPVPAACGGATPPACASKTRCWARWPRACTARDPGAASGAMGRMVASRCRSSRRARTDRESSDDRWRRRSPRARRDPRMEASLGVQDKPVETLEVEVPESCPPALTGRRLSRARPAARRGGVGGDACGDMQCQARRAQVTAAGEEAAPLRPWAWPAARRGHRPRRAQPGNPGERALRDRPARAGAGRRVVKHADTRRRRERRSAGAPDRGGGSTTWRDGLVTPEPRTASVWGGRATA